MWPLKALMMAASVVTGFQNGKFLFSRSSSSLSSLYNPCLLQSTEGSNMLSVIEDSSTSPSSLWEPYLESGGFCNHLYKHRNEKKMLKLYSELALKRMELSGFKVGELDIQMGKAGLGPTIYNTTKTHMIMEQLQGSVLTQQALCQPNIESMLDAVSKTLAKLHCLPTKNNENMLWKCCHMFLDKLDQYGETELFQFYSEQIHFQQQKLDQLKLPTVLGHGDFKPSNIIMIENTNEAKLVDWETCGCHYRAYDLSKLFRSITTGTEGKGNSQVVTNQRLFLKQYCQYIANDNASQCGPEQVLLESKLLLPMTWLEAAMFFHCKSFTEKEYDTLAKDRLQHYQESLRDWNKHVQEYKSLFS